MKYNLTLAKRSFCLRVSPQDIADKNQQKASIEADIQGFNADLDLEKEEKEGLAGQNAELHSQCDFRLKNYAIRAAAMRNEINALKDVEH